MIKYDVIILHILIKIDIFVHKNAYDYYTWNCEYFFLQSFYLFDRASELIDIDLHLYEKLIL